MTSPGLVGVLALAGSLALPLGPAVSAHADQSSRSRTRLFPAQDLGLIDTPDRAQWQKPDLIMDALSIADGAVVADLGAGSGWFSIQLARRVGPNGIVYAEDIQPEMIDAISRRVQRDNLTWVRPILGTAADPRLPPGVDAVLIIDTYHEVEDPVTLLKNAARSLKPQGVIGVVDFLAGSGGPGPAPDERPDPDAVASAAADAGLRLKQRLTIPPFLFLLVFERAGRPTQ